MRRALRRSICCGRRPGGAGHGHSRRASGDASGCGRSSSSPNRQSLPRRSDAGHACGGGKARRRAQLQRGCPFSRHPLQRRRWGHLCRRHVCRASAWDCAERNCIPGLSSEQPTWALNFCGCSCDARARRRIVVRWPTGSLPIRDWGGWREFAGAQVGRAGGDAIRNSSLRHSPAFRRGAMERFRGGLLGKRLPDRGRSGRAR